jgi:hypothetical protein
LDAIEGVFVDERLVAPRDTAPVVLDDPPVVLVAKQIVNPVRAKHAFGKALTAATAKPLGREMLGEVAMRPVAADVQREYELDQWRANRVELDAADALADGLALG